MMKNRILFINHIAHDFINGAEPLGIMYLSEVAKRNGFETRLVYPDYAKLIGVISEWKPAIVAYSITSDHSVFYRDLNSRLKQKFDFISIFGGPHVTFFPEFIEQSKDVDIICVGEGEYAFDVLLGSIKEGRDYSCSPNLWVRKGNHIAKNKPARLMEPLEQIGFPDRGILYDTYDLLRTNPIKTFMTARGCPFECTYCFNHSYHELYKGSGEVIRRLKVDHVIREIQTVKEKYPLKNVLFLDDTFNIMPGWIEEFSRKYKRSIGLPFTCCARIDLLEEGMVRNLKEAGCAVMHLAIESGNSEVRYNVLNRKMSTGKIVEGANLLKKYKIFMLVQNMLGLPGTTLENDMETFLLNRDCNVDYAHSSVFQPYPGTRLAKAAVEKGYFDGDYSKLDKGDYPKGISHLNIRHKSKIRRLNKIFALAVCLKLSKRSVGILISLPLLKLYEVIYILFKGYSGKKLYNVTYSKKQIIGIFFKLFNK
ncbi:MAG: radical SAM protein [Candidatus Omnitrophica bacterium]|nr:radical SAM protein [Candidatus Omnitrophota bacterium]